MARFNFRARIATVVLALGLMTATWFPYAGLQQEAGPKAEQIAPRANLVEPVILANTPAILTPVNTVAPVTPVTTIAAPLPKETATLPKEPVKPKEPTNTLTVNILKQLVAKIKAL